MFYSDSGIPSEILRHILREATYLPLDTEWNYPTEIALWDGWTSETNPSSTKVLRMNLVLVSKRWREIAIEFLYECLHLFPRDGELETEQAMASQLDALASVFEKSGSPGYGWWTRRIEISSLAIRPAATDSLGRFLNTCSNVHTVSLIGPPSV